MYSNRITSKGILSQNSLLSTVVPVLLTKIVFMVINGVVLKQSGQVGAELSASSSTSRTPVQITLGGTFRLTTENISLGFSSHI